MQGATEARARVKKAEERRIERSKKKKIVERKREKFGMQLFGTGRRWGGCSWYPGALKKALRAGESF